jgi:excisionase family DNA binding protein
MSTDREELLTVEEAAEWLQMHPQTLRNYINAGRLPALRAGPRRVWLRRSDVEGLLTAFEATPAEERQAARELQEPNGDQRQELGRALDHARAIWASQTWN